MGNTKAIEVIEQINLLCVCAVPKCHIAQDDDEDDDEEDENLNKQNTSQRVELAMVKDINHDPRTHVYML